MQSPRTLQTHLEEKGGRVMDDWLSEWRRRFEGRVINGYVAIPPTRWTKGKDGRLLPLNNAAWRKLRAQVLAEQPLCPECEARGEVVPATEVHHLDDNKNNNSRDNLVALCKPCHSRHTAADMGKRVNHGCDTNGMPLDGNHGWNRGADPLKKITGSR